MSHTISFPKEAFSLAAIKRAAYRFSDRFSVEINPGNETTDCVCRFLNPCSDDEAMRTLEAFRIEVLDHDLRLTVAKETEAVRNAVLAYAFSRTGLQDGE